MKKELKGLRWFKKGVASFYIVAFSTLIMVVVSTGFATVILSESTRTGNDDLSQSAYDSALAGVDDAKLAYSNYRRCKAEGKTATDPVDDGVVTCGEIIYWMEHPECAMVGKILGRTIGEGGDVLVSDSTESSGGSEVSRTNQAYTCVMVNTDLNDYRAVLNSSNKQRVIKVDFSDDNRNAIAASRITAVRLSWYMNRVDAPTSFGNFRAAGDSSRVTFQPDLATQVVAPPTMALQMIQTSRSFKMEDFDIAKGGQTDRATMYFVPTNDSAAARNSTKSTYLGIYDGSENLVKASQVAKTNDRSIKNKPFATLCADASSSDAASRALSSRDFACSVVINLPEPINGNRSDDTFMFMVSLPYGQPDTEFAMEFYYDNSLTAKAWIRDAQIVVDSTGRANDLVRRVETRLESGDASFPYPVYALELLGENNTLVKNFIVRSEHNFYH